MQPFTWLKTEKLELLTNVIDESKLATFNAYIAFITRANGQRPSSYIHFDVEFQMMPINSIIMCISFGNLFSYFQIVCKYTHTARDILMAFISLESIFILSVLEFM